MGAAVAALAEFLSDEAATEPQGWNRSDWGASKGMFRRRPDLTPESEFEDM